MLVKLKAPPAPLPLLWQLGAEAALSCVPVSAQADDSLCSDYVPLVSI